MKNEIKYLIGGVILGMLAHYSLTKILATNATNLATSTSGTKLGMSDSDLKNTPSTRK